MTSRTLALRPAHSTPPSRAQHSAANKRMALLSRTARQQRGVATLMVVMSLFFVVSLVAAYASRNLIFEQRTSSNQYRSTQAFEAAEAGLEWGLALANSGRIDASCAASSDPANTSLRQRMLSIDPETGLIAPNTWLSGGATRILSAGCVRSEAGWACSCPTGADPVLAPPAAAGAYPAFRVQFEAVGTAGLLRLTAHGCSAASAGCLNNGTGVGGEAGASVTSLVALAPAMPTSPAAALTAHGDIDLGGFALRVANADPATNGITVHSGGAVDIPGAVLETVPGTPAGQSVVAGDASLAALSAERMFTSFFGAPPAVVKRQAATVVVVCAATGCATELQTAVTLNPGRPIWVEGDLVLETGVDIGTADAPVLLISTGAITLAPATRIVGIVYAQTADWVSTGTGVVQGALMAQGRIGGSSAPAVQFDAAVVNQVRLSFGNLIRVPGGWKDF